MLHVLRDPGLAQAVDLVQQHRAVEAHRPRLRQACGVVMWDGNGGLES